MKRISLRAVTLFLMLLSLGAFTFLTGCGGSSAVPSGAPKELKADAWLNTPGVKLADLKGKKAVVVEFWATWCPPCRQSIPHLRKLHETYQDVLVLVSLTNEPLAKVEAFAKENNMTWPLGMGSSSGGDYGVSGIPHAIVIDREGKFVWAGHPMAGLDQQLQKMFPAVSGK